MTMCLAIAPNKQSASGTVGRLWRTISSTPLRLLSFCALVHALVLGAVLLYNTITTTAPDVHAYLFGLSYGIFALLAFGYLLTVLPKKYSLSPTHYGRYNTINLLMMIGLVILEAGILADSDWILAGMFLLVPAWLVALQSIRNLHTWIYADAEPISRQLMMLLRLNFFNLILSIAAGFYPAGLLSILIVLSSILLIWPLTVVVARELVLSAPAKGRIISL